MHFTSYTLALAALAASVHAQGDPQKSKTLLDNQIQKIDNGGGAKAEGQVDSATSTNNFINFCATKDLPLTNGKQVKTGSCNPTPQGVILATDRMPACKFTTPANLGVVKANENFTISLKIENFSTGFFTDPDNTYFAAPQNTNNDRFMTGHSHVTINKVDSITTTAINPATEFAFFKGLNGKADENGILSVVVAGGLEEGDYRACSINSAANHQPALVAVAQHASLDDCIYFSATSDGQDPADEGDNGNDNASGDNKNQNNASGGSGSSGSNNGKANESKGKGNGESKGKNDNKADENQQEAARCRAKRLRRRATHQKRAAELERLRRQRRA